MKCLNKVQLIGYLGRDPEIKEFSTGNALAIFRIATDSFYPREDGKLIKRTDWHSVTLWGKASIAKFCSSLMKGSHILVEGQLVHKKVKSRTGHFYEATDIKAYLIVDLDR